MSGETPDLLIRESSFQGSLPEADRLSRRVEWLGRNNKRLANRQQLRYPRPQSIRSYKGIPMHPEEMLFTCQMCDDCCHGENTINLAPADVHRMASGLRLSEKDFLGKYCVLKGIYIQMKVVDNHCIFWNGKCTIHAFKPARCHAWPFVPGLLDPSSFLIIQQNCPGFNKSIRFEEALPYIKKVLGKPR